MKYLKKEQIAEYNKANNLALSVSLVADNIIYEAGDIVVSDDTNKPIMDALRNASIIDSSKTQLTLSECLAITSLPQKWLSGNSDISQFLEFRFFTGLTTLPMGCLFKGNLYTQNFTNVILPKTLKSFSGTHVLLERTYLRCVIIPEGFTSIPNVSFGNCYRLRYIEFPETVKSIGNQALMRIGVAGKQAYVIGATAYYLLGVDNNENCGCTLVFHSKTPPTIGTGNNWIYSDLFNYMIDKFRVYVPDDAVATYKAHSHFSTVADYIYPLSELPYTYYDRIKMQYDPNFFKIKENSV